MANITNGSWENEAGTARNTKNKTLEVFSRLLELVGYDLNSNVLNMGRFKVRNKNITSLLCDSTLVYLFPTETMQTSLLMQYASRKFVAIKGNRNKSTFFKRRAVLGMVDILGGIVIIARKQRGNVRF